MASKLVYARTALTGGSSIALDNIDGAVLADGDFALVMYGGNFYSYVLDDDSAAAESSPDVISPDSNAGDKRWILQNAIPGGVNVLIYKGVLDCSGNPNYPAADAGALYVISVAGKVGGASGTDVEVGDAILCNTDGTTSGDEAAKGAYWDVLQGSFNLADYAALAGATFTGNVAIGSASAGKNLTVNATEGSEMSPALEGANWTCGTDGTGGWTANAGTLVKTTSAGTQTATPSGTFSVTAGRTYKVVIVCSAVSGTIYYTLGSSLDRGTTITATTITDYFVAGSTSKIVFYGGASDTCTITSVSVKELTPATGLITLGSLNLYSQLLLPVSGGTYPAIAPRNTTACGIYFYNNNTVNFATQSVVHRFNGAAYAIYSDSAALILGNNSDLYVLRDAAETLALRRTTNQQIFRIYNTYTNSSNYERLTLTGVAGASVNITAETAGTGGDNLDLVLTPAGTGLLKNTASVITSGSGTGVTVNHTGAVIQQIYKVTTTYAAYSDTDTTKGIVIATLPAKTRLIACYAETTAAYTGGAVSAATLEVGITAEGAAEIIATHDVFSGAVTKGLADADMGTGMTRAAQIQGAYTPSFTGTTAIYATIDTTTANTNALTAGSTTFYLITERLP